MRQLMSIIVFVFAIYGLICAAAFVFQSRLMFFPQRESNTSIAELEPLETERPGESGALLPLSRSTAVMELIRRSFSSVALEKGALARLTSIVQNAECYVLRTDDFPGALKALCQKGGREYRPGLVA